METRLAYRLRQLTPQQRADLCAHLPISESTFWRVLRDPGSKLTLVEGAKITRFLEELDGCDYDTYHLLNEVNINA